MTRLRHALATAVLAPVLAVLTLTGCSDDDGVATDPGGTQGSQQPEPTPETAPTASPTVGGYPSYRPTDYRFTLTVSCFCPDAGVPVRVTVEDGSVTAAVYAENGPGVHRGDPAPKHRALTIDDVIDRLNAATEAETVRVDWPEGQDYPSEVWIDESSRIADEEIGYTLTEVEVG